MAEESKVDESKSESESESKPANKAAAKAKEPVAPKDPLAKLTPEQRAAMEDRIARAELEATAKVSGEVIDRVLPKRELKQVGGDALAKEEMVEYSVPFPVRINGKLMPLRGQARYSVAQQIIAAASAKRQRLLKEKVSTEHEAIMLSNGQITSRVVKRETEDGQVISSR